MSNPTVSSEIEKILQEVVDNAVQLSKVYGLQAKYVPDYSEALSKLEELIKKSKIEENQVPLDRINNFNPGPGQLTTASFGSAGGAMETASWKQYFENRIKALQKGQK